MKLQYEPALDGLRAIAVLMVVGYHASVPLMGGGVRGVDVFFVLSGYLITSLLRGGAADDLASFWQRRLLRLYPALLLFLAVYVAAVPFTLPGTPSATNRWFDATVSALYLADHFGASGAMKGLGHMWSLSVEMQFYLLFPFVVRALGRVSPQRAQQILLAGWLVVTLARGAAFLVTRDFPATYAPGYFHCSGLLLGASLAYGPWPARFGWLGLLGLAELLLFSFRHDAEGGMVWRISLAELSAAAVLSAAMDPATRIRRALSWRPLVQLGVLSYGVYLWHFLFVHALHGRPWPAVLAAALVGGIGASFLSHRTVERWARGWRGARRRAGLVAAE